MATAEKLREHMWVGTENTIFGVEGMGESTFVKALIPPTFVHTFPERVVYTGLSGYISLLAECQQLREQNATLMAENESLQAKVVAMEATNSAETVLDVRDIPREQAKEEIRAFFKDHHGKAIYPSDVMEALSLDYDLVYEICEELEREGALKGL